MKFELHYKDENGVEIDDVVNIRYPEDLQKLSREHDGKALLLEFGKTFNVQRIVIRKDNEEWI